MSAISIDGESTGLENVNVTLPHGASEQPAIAGLSACVVVAGMKAGTGPFGTSWLEGPCHPNVPLDGADNVAVTVIPEGMTPVAVVGFTIVHVAGYSLPAGNADAVPGSKHASATTAAVAPSSTLDARRVPRAARSSRVRRARVQRAHDGRLPLTGIGPSLEDHGGAPNPVLARNHSKQLDHIHTLVLQQPANSAPSGRRSFRQA
jgi:hypothetical protein